MKLSAADIKYVKTLQQKKFRKQYGVFLAEGEKVVNELVSSEFEIEGIYGLGGWVEQFGHQIRKGVPLFTVSESELTRISGLKTPNRVLAVVKTPNLQVVPDPTSEGLILALDTIQDPGNLGTIIRTADWFNIRQVVCSPDTAEVFSPKVIQATMGSFLRVKVFYTDLAAFLKKAWLKVPVYGAFLQGDDVFEVSSGKGCILVVGNESAGISAEVAKYVSKRLKIPGGAPPVEGFQADSLNASVAAGILMAILTRS
ncbi:MAG TPA: RNA methyltransferase [Bacteroidales bacterium]|nr:RNA methyltransferase [Bacteroidales bacterium]